MDGLQENRAYSELRQLFRLHWKRAQVTQIGERGFHWKFIGEIVPHFTAWGDGAKAVYPKGYKVPA